MEARRAVSTKTKLKIHDEYVDVFTSTGCLKSTFSLQVRDNVKSYQALMRHEAYCCKKHYKKELERQHHHQILVPLEVDKMAEWCMRFHKSNATV